MFKSTSHFIGIGLNIEKMINVFLLINQYFIWRDNISYYSLSPLSPHITLYYLPEELTIDYLDAIRKTLDDITDNWDSNIEIGGVNYFLQNKRNVIIYIEPIDNSYLRWVHDKIMNIQSFNEILDNQYEYIPHLTIWKLTLSDDVDESILKGICAELFWIIQDSYDFDYLAESISLYRVNSKIIPELQFPIFTKMIKYEPTTQWL